MTDTDLVNDYVLGSLSPLERREVERLRQFDPELDGRIGKLEAQMAPLAASAGEAAPPAGLFHRILDKVAIAEGKHAGLHKLAFADGEWEVYSEGVEQKFLWNRDTFLLRCAPGAIIPPHGHELNEHLVVVSGDLFVDGLEFGVGDYHTMPMGTRHDDARTVGGCILLIQSLAN